MNVYGEGFVVGSSYQIELYCGSGFPSPPRPNESDGGLVSAIGLQAGKSYLGNNLLIIGNRNLTLYKTPKRKGVSFSRSTFSYSEHLGATGWAYALSCWFAILHSYTLGVLHFSFGSAFHTIGLHVFTPFCFCKVVLSHISALNPAGQGITNSSSTACDSDKLPPGFSACLTFVFRTSFLLFEAKTKSCGMGFLVLRRFRGMKILWPIEMSFGSSQGLSLAKTFQFFWEPVYHFFLPALPQRNCCQT
jgi:hypothetical protein